MTTTAHDLAVIGGGIIGSAIAWGASRTGADVVLLDEGDVAWRAARGNFGLVWLQGKGVGMPPYMHWSLRAGALWPEFAGLLESASGLETGWRRCGGFHFCMSEDELEQRRRVRERSAADGARISIEILERQQLRGILPRIGEEVAGASFCPDDGHVNPLRLLRALHRALQAGGGRYRPDARVERLAADGNAFRIETRSGKLHARRIVLAAGLGNVALGPQVGLPLPLAPERGQIVVTERLKPFFPYVSNCLQQTAEGTILIGSTHEQGGFDDDTEVRSAGRLVRNALRVFPMLGQVNVVRYWASLRILSPDHLPIYQESEQCPGAFAVTCHSGVTLASVHALELGPALTQGMLPASTRAFSSARFHVPTH